MKKLNETLSKVVNAITEVTGKPVIFALAVVVIVGWLIVGIFFRYNDIWFNILVVFVFLTTLFLVFVVQSTQNADTRAMQDKPDEIIDSLPKANDNKKVKKKQSNAAKRTTSSGILEVCKMCLR